MYLSRVKIRVLAEPIARLDNYALHQLLWKLFPDHQGERPFLFRVLEKNNTSEIFLLSSLKPLANSKCVVESKEFSPNIGEGERLVFDLRFNPTIKKKQEGGSSKRHDIVMNLWREQRAEDRQEIIQSACLSWLTQRSDKFGFAVDNHSTRVDGYRQIRNLASNRGRDICFSSVDCTGVLTVRDPERFISTVREGIGSSKAFGCGLLLFRRPCSQ
jgi:CRISPR system Cascade subunit CasE